MLKSLIHRAAFDSDSVDSQRSVLTCLITVLWNEITESDASPLPALLPLHLSSPGSRLSSKTWPPGPTLLSSSTTAPSKQTSSKLRSFLNKRWPLPGTIKQTLRVILMMTIILIRRVLLPGFSFLLSPAGILISARWTKSPLTWALTFLQSSLLSSRTVQITPVSCGCCYSLNM